MVVFELVWDKFLVTGRETLTRIVKALGSEIEVVILQEHTQKLLFYSKLAFYPMHWEAFRHICLNYRVVGTVIANSSPSLPSVHRQLGWVDPQEEARNGFAPEVFYIPPGRHISQMLWLARQLWSIRPDAIWVQEEPTDHFLLAILLAYFFNRQPRIVTAVCENVFSPGILPIRLAKQLLWSRLDGLLGVAPPSIEGIRKVGMPSQIPAITPVAGALSPPEIVQPLPLPFDRTDDDFVVAFAGRICEQKGWRVLLAALASLPNSYKCIFAGDGEEIAELLITAESPALKGRVFHLGLFPKEQLWGFYRSADCLVLPSIDVPYPKEQFGGVLADAMAMGLPVIGSNVGGIPYTIGPAGLVVPDNQSAPLATAIHTLREDKALYQQLSKAGQKRFYSEFAIPAYADKIAHSLGLVEC